MEWKGFSDVAVTVAVIRKSRLTLTWFKDSAGEMEAAFFGVTTLWKVECRLIGAGCPSWPERCEVPHRLRRHNFTCAAKKFYDAFDVLSASAA
jgi:hypothetical protein